MAPRNGRSDKQLKKQVEKQADNALGRFAIVALVACALINAYFTFLSPGAAKPPVPDMVFWILGAAIVPDLVKFFRGDKS